MKFERRVSVLAAACVAVTMALGAATGALAHPVVGFTWYSDGSFSKSGPSGTVISAHASGARPNTEFQLVVGTHAGGDVDHVCIFDRTNVNPNVRVSSGSGVIGRTSGPVTMPVGNWQVCFMSLTTVTAPVGFTVV